jgi:hypothetical protein
MKFCLCVCNRFPLFRVRKQPIYYYILPPLPSNSDLYIQKNKTIWHSDSRKIFMSYANFHLGFLLHFSEVVYTRCLLTCDFRCCVYMCSCMCVTSTFFRKKRFISVIVLLWGKSCDFFTHCILSTMMLCLV